MQKLPSWLIKKIPKQENIRKIRAILDNNIHTVCESAKCPNIGECFSQNALTFMILGNICTRNCAFCGIEKGIPLPVDPEEPKRIADAVRKLNLEYVVITSVTRDDLQDGGAEQFRRSIVESRKSKIGIKIEVLIPDFNGDIEALGIVVESNPYVINHNIETVLRLYSQIRPQADYQRSLQLLKNVKKIDKTVYTKSGFMVGLGETDEEIVEVLQDLKEAGVDIVTIGQYLAPSKSHAKVERFVNPETFDYFKQVGKKFGFLQVHSGPFVRSSYQARIINPYI